ncbi:MAG: response regulator, partial [Gammaproteobacteria bacterium]|nr:response regulator [Gammaproteobacteria bacterium]
MNQKHRAHTKGQQSGISFLPDFASILIVDDQRFDRVRLRRLLDAIEITTHIVEAESLESMGTALGLDTFDLVILDFNLADGTGLDAINAVRMDRKNRLAATIMVTGSDQFDIATEAMRRGCSDYIVKDDLSKETLQRAMINALQKSSLQTGLEDQEKLRRQVETVLDGFAKECVLEIKPMLSRMMRQLRNLGTLPASRPETFHEEHAAIER